MSRQVRMRCASGARKRVNVMVLHLPQAGAPPSLVHLFYEVSSEAGARRRSRPLELLVPQMSESPTGSIAEANHYSRLTPRELEVVRLLAAGAGTQAIRERLQSEQQYGRLNHIRNAREKLHATTRLELVLTAQRLGLIPGVGQGSGGEPAP